MPDNPYEPDHIHEFEKTTQYVYDFEYEKSPEEVSEFLSQIEHDLSDATYHIRYQLEDENGETHWYQSEAHLMEEFEDFELWYDDFDGDADSYSSTSTGGFSVVIVGT